MGTQQVLLIVITVIIVGIAIAVGMTMFNQNAIKSNRHACIADANNFATIALAWWRTPVSQGGGGQVNLNTAVIDDLGSYIGYNYNSSSNTLYTSNGSYVLSNAGNNNLKIVATGNEFYNGNPVEISLTVHLQTGNISVEIIN
ncbi:MAG: hypothetical protein KAU01_10915 [Candidatus Cloacimonetes bacterium]|nr:hypothetical protein [Candidatus Cloacimonadota bacterium]